jgi:hypothetical protein
MSVRFFYVDESHDDKKTRFCLSAFGIRHADWAVALKMVQEHLRVPRWHFDSPPVSCERSRRRRCAQFEPQYTNLTTLIPDRHRCGARGPCGRLGFRA